MNPRKKWLIAAIIAAVLLVAGGAGYLIYQAQHRPLLPQAIGESVSFSVLYPKLRGLTVDQKSMSYNDRTHVLIFSAQLNVPRSKLSFTQQPTPGSSSGGGSDIDFNALVRAARKYHEFTVPSGTVVVYDGSSKTAGTTTVLNSQGTALYIRSTPELNDATWRKIYNSLVLAE